MDLNLFVYDSVDSQYDEMNDTVSVAENFSFQFDVLNALAWDDITLQFDDFELTDVITVTEFVSLLSSDIISVSVFDTVGHTESVELVRDRVVSNRFDNIAITEQASFIFDWGITVSDDVLITEVVSTLVSPNAEVFDSITIIEDAPLLVSPNLDVFDTVTITEDAQVIQVHFLSVFDTFDPIVEEATASPDPLIILATEPFFTLVTEHTDVLDLVVEVGVVMEPISVFEDAQTQLDALFMFAYEDITIVEDVVAAPEPLVAVFDTVTAAEDFQAYLEINIEVGEDIILGAPSAVFDEITITEFVLPSFQEAPEINVYDEVTVTEDAQTANSELYLDVFDAVSVVEDVSMNDIIIELGVVYDDVAIAEDVQAAADPAADVFDAIGVIEDTQQYLDSLNINVYDEAAIAEDTAQYLDVLNVDVLEPFYSLVTEHVDVVDLVVEVGVVMEPISVAEEAQASLDVLYLDVFDTVSPITEDASASLDVLNIDVFYALAAIVEDVTSEIIFGPSVYDEILVVEDVVLTDLVVELGPVFDEPSITEDAALYLEINIAVYDEAAIIEFVNMVDLVVELEASDDILVTEDFQASVSIDIDVYDEAAIVEAVSVNDIIIELGIVYDDVLATEFVDVFLPILAVDIYDEVSIAEVGTVHDLVIELGPAVDLVAVAEDVTIAFDVLNAEAIELIAALEQFLRDMPINFEVAEQKGIAIITVSGW